MIAIELYKLIRQTELFVMVLYSHSPSGSGEALGLELLCLQPPPQSGKAGTKIEFSGEDATEMSWLYLQE